MKKIQKIFIKYGSEYLQKFARDMPRSHRKAIEAINNCRSKRLGGQIFYCKGCDEYHYSYHSCQNRHCPICQNDKADKWLEKQKKLLLPLKYFLGTFTIPAELRDFCRKNQKLFYNILFKTSAHAAIDLAKDERFIGGQIGLIGILHTWSRTLTFHPHIHFLIPGGGLSDDGSLFHFSDDNFLLRVEPLSIIFRAKFREALKKEAPEIFSIIPKSVWKKDWVVHIKAVGNGESTIKYLCQYVFRVAISESRIAKVENGLVTFRYKDSNTGNTKIVTITAMEFIRRFLQHVLPHKFIKVRYYGLFAPKNKDKLKKVREMLFVKLQPEKDKQKYLGIPKKRLCPVCGKPMFFICDFYKWGMPREP